MRFKRYWSMSRLTLILNWEDKMAAKTGVLWASSDQDDFSPYTRFHASKKDIAKASCVAALCNTMLDKLIGFSVPVGGKPVQVKITIRPISRRKK